MNNVLEYFEQTAERFPQKRAVAYRDTVYTFAQLADMAKRLGTAIARCGISGEPVGVIVNRGADTAVMFLAVLYSGNYYIPIDPEMPVSKIQLILDDSKLKVMLYGEENTELLQSLEFAGDKLMLSDMAKEPTGVPKTSADAPIYMVYTSGSTGKPKGVLKSHGAVISFVTTYAGHFGLGSDEIIGNQTPFFFDASAKDYYLSLFTGATLEILPSEMFIFPVTLVEYMNERKISYVCWVPTALAIVTQMNTFKKVLPETLKKVFFVGEVFPLKQLQKWMKTLPDIQYVNLYGSSELAGICCYAELDSRRESIDYIPMGKPLPNCEVFLLDGDRRVTEQGVIGEVNVISQAIALEYWNDPEKTAATFADTALPDGTVHRTLRTGDLARYDEDGNLVFVSRKDFQIKHMGRRIELGEIESVADKLTEIQRCCCLYDEKRKMIKLFCELIPGCDWDGKAVQSAMRGRISDYMLPNRVIILDSMPLNANGKINRTQLKEMM